MKDAEGDGAPRATSIRPAREAHLPPLNWLRGFEATARVGSFTGAAEALGLSQAAISYQIRSLEKHLGLALFERQARGVRLTELGKAYLPRVQKAFAEISAATAGLFGSRGNLTLVIRTHPSFAALWLAPRLTSFRTAHPRISLRIYSAIWGATVPAEEADVEIRYGDGDWPGFRAEPLHGGPVIVVAAPDPGRPSSGYELMEALRGRSLIEIMEVDTDWPLLFAGAGCAPPKPEQVIRVDSTLMALELAAAGLGSAIVLAGLAQPYLSSGRLVDLGILNRPARMSHYVLHPIGDARRRPEAEAFLSWLRSTASMAGNRG